MLSYLLTKDNIPLDGHPVITTDNWNLTDSMIDFKFNDPINSVDSIPDYELFKPGKVSNSKAIEVIFDRDYIDTATVAWFTIDEYAKKGKYN